jgi:hypothetical protein
MDMTTTAAEYLIRNCKIAVDCAARWEDLIDDGIHGIRFCDACQKEVHLCQSPEALMEAMVENQCVAIELRNDKRQMFMGLVLPITNEKLKRKKEK